MNARPAILDIARGTLMRKVCRSRLKWSTARMAERWRSVDAAWLGKLPSGGLAGLSKTLSGYKEASAHRGSCYERSINVAVTLNWVK